MIKIFSVFDKKALAYMQPFYFANKGEAIRALEDITNDSGSRINKHPADFSLWILGEYDDKTGSIKPLDKPQFLEEAANTLKKVN
ncbi:MAG: nonstructural protein [Microvirus sp.]|nr:MAG: nonstructural protein [Microvirus sp.]